MRRCSVFSHDDGVLRRRGLEYVDVDAATFQEAGFTLLVSSDTDDPLEGISKAAPEGRPFVRWQGDAIPRSDRQYKFGEVQIFKHVSLYHHEPFLFH